MIVKIVINQIIIKGKIKKLLTISNLFNKERLKFKNKKNKFNNSNYNNPKI